jgi:hypothetical protein
VPPRRARPDFRLQGLLDDLTGFAMFASARCVTVAEPEALLKKSAGARNRRSPKPCAASCGAARGTLVLVADSLRSDLAIVKELVQAGALLKTFRKLYDRPAPWERDPDPRRTELVAWLVQRAEGTQSRADGRSGAVLAHSQGNDLAALDDQLSALASGGAKDALARLMSNAAGSPAQVAGRSDRGRRGEQPARDRDLVPRRHARERDGARETDDAALVQILLGYLRPRVRAGVAASEAIERGRDGAGCAGEAGSAPMTEHSVIRSASALRGSGARCSTIWSSSNGARGAARRST